MELSYQSSSPPPDFFFRLMEDLGTDLPEMSLRPLYQAFRGLPEEKVGTWLVQCSSKQRQGLLDIDLWKKDNVDIARFEFWLEAYDKCRNEEVLEEFVKSISFQLYLKSRFNISTFDFEDPCYPEHDYYFLTEDNQLLFEFDENYRYADEIRKYLRLLYSFLGVENAYSYLMKTVVDTFSYMQECEYEAKKTRLSEYGFLDYYESLEFESCYPNLKSMNMRLNNRSLQTSHLPKGEEKNLKLSKGDMIPFQDYGGDIADELNKVKDVERRNYLETNFILLINANTVFNGDLLWEKNPLPYRRMIQRTCSFLLLGIDYLRDQGHADPLFERFDFVDFYKVGKTLIKEGQRPLKKTLTQKSYLKSFCGTFWETFWEESLGKTVLFQGKRISNYETYKKWLSWSKGSLNLLPFIETLKKTWDEMVKEGKVQDSFYLNYNLDQVNFEVILLSGLANHYLYPALQANDSVKPKLGLTIDEFKLFAKGISSTPPLQTLAAFYGLSKIPRIEEYLHALLREHLEGVDYEALSPEEFCHVGGPIILTRLL